MFEQGSVRTRAGDLWAEDFTACVKALRNVPGVWKAVRRPLWYSRVSRWRGGREEVRAGRGLGRSCRVSW